ncbi:hypothetical protein Dda_8197 [Drechslerella dactyloides]|uniref:CCHC-type domain-containing protein n=1 Tax=Drechslerella dactyloides TaxID=74499 RepID=A0AAD6IRT5_DREDA|nr:hypothetical protein Dda_8197 [Drechslerella dactyloides]
MGFSTYEPAPHTAYYHTGIGGAGNYRRLTATEVSTPRPTPSNIKPQPRPFYGGRGGIGNAHMASERAIFSFDEELQRDRLRHERIAPMYTVGRGGAGNIVPHDEEGVDFDIGLDSESEGEGAPDAIPDGALQGGTDGANEATPQESSKQEIVDLTASSEPATSSSQAPALSNPAPHQDSPLETQGMTDFTQTSLKALDADESKADDQAPRNGDEDSSAESDDDDSDMMDDSGITLNLQEDEKEEAEPQYITIHSSSDDEEPEKGRSKRPKASEFGASDASSVSASETTKSNGAIAVSTGLKLGKAGKAAVGVAKVTRRPLAESIKAGLVQVVDYSNAEDRGQSPVTANVLKGLSPQLASVKPVEAKEVEVVDLVSDPVSVTETENKDIAPRKQRMSLDGNDSDGDENDFTRTDSNDVIQLEDDDEEDGEISDNESSTSSIDTDAWAQQQRYYVRLSSPPLLVQEDRPPFESDVSCRDMVQRTLAMMSKQSMSKKRKICDVCLEPHSTERCDKLKCDVCKSSHEHFSFSCPYKTSAYKELSSLPICNVPAGQRDFEIWRIHPTRPRSAVKMAAKIPVACYECGSNDHFGDDCPTLGSLRTDIPSESIWSAKSAAKWTTMNLDSKYIKKAGKSKVTAIDIDDSEPSWFEMRMIAAKAVVPDSEFQGRSVEEDIMPQRQQHRGNEGNGRRIQMNLPRSFPGQNYNEASSGPSFTRFQPPGGPLASRVGPKGDNHRPDQSGRRDRSRSPRRHSFDRRGSYGGGPPNYRDRDFPRGNGPQPPYRGGRQDYHEAPPPPQFQQTYQQPQGGASGGWSLPGSIQRSVQSSSQPPLPPGPPPSGPPPPPQQQYRGSGGGRHGGGRGHRSGKRGKR